MKFSTKSHLYCISTRLDDLFCYILSGWPNEKMQEIEQAFSGGLQVTQPLLQAKWS